MTRESWGVIASVVIAAVFLLSGVTKLASTAQWRTQSAGLGVSWPVARVVPYVEVVLGALLLVRWQTHIVAWCAVAVLGIFTVLIGWTLLHGRRPPCACFGSWSAKPIGPGHLVRNAVFIVVALAAALW